ncbi:MAG TPA: kelch repeat-containing protein, partial [Myxococcaceae bacterium]
MSKAVWRGVFVGGVLGSMGGCIDFDQEKQAFCERNAVACDARSRLPRFEEAIQAPAEEGQGGVTFRVTARTSLSREVSFSWETNVGELTQQQDGETTSKIRWDPPPCVPSHLTPTITVTASSPQGDTSTRTFYVAGNVFCPNWMLTGRMSAPRYRHTATLLPTGKVLVTGGLSEWNMAVQATTEVYDPSTGLWTNAPRMFQPRAGHTATLLPSGRVLVAGGQTNASLGISSSEEYVPGESPGTSQWQETSGGMSSSRANHTATLLPSGKVLVTGGYRDDSDVWLDPLDTTELYDPELRTRAWSKSANLGVAQWSYSNAAILLESGKVLLAGGKLSGVAQYSDSAAEYDPGKETWAAPVQMLFPVAGHAAVKLLSGKVLLAGGSTTSTQVYAPATGGAWSQSASLKAALTGHTATLLATGEVLVAGGTEMFSALSQVQLYSEPRDTWVDSAPMKEARSSHTATLLPSGLVLVTGGSRAATALASAELYDRGTGTWSASCALTIPRLGHTVTVLASNQVL